MKKYVVLIVLIIIVGFILIPKYNKIIKFNSNELKRKQFAMYVQNISKTEYEVSFGTKFPGTGYILNSNITVTGGSGSTTNPWLVS